MILRTTIKTSLSLTIGLLTIISSGCSRTILTKPATTEVVTISSASSDNEYIVKRRGLSYLDGDVAFQDKFGLKIQKEIKSIAVDIVKVDSPENVDKLKADPSIEYVEPNYIRKMKIQPSSATTSTANTSSIQQSGIVKANSIYTGKSFTTIAVVSTGVDLNHPDLKGKLVTGFSAFSDTDSAQDVNGAGTHQAGVIVASNPSAGVYGIAPSCKVMPIKVMSQDGEAKDGDLIQGVAWAIDHGANVVTFTVEGAKPSKAFDDLIKYAYTKKVPLVVGSGDSASTTPTYPAASKGVIAVTSIDQGNTISSFSNTGDFVSVSAPGQNIMSTSSTKNAQITPNYALLSGTSIAAAYVAGEVALIKTKYPLLDMVAIRKHLELTTDDIGTPGPDNNSGFGKINVVKALSINPPKSK